MTEEAATVPVKKGLKKLPTPVLIAGGGAVIGLGYAFLRDRNGGEDTSAVDEAYVDPYAYASEGVGAIPTGVAYVGTPTPTDSGEVVGAVGQTALDSLLGLVGEILNRPQPPIVIPPGYGVINPADPGNGSLPASPPPPPATPTPAPTQPTKPKKPGLPPGYHAGGTITDGKLRKNFPAAEGWARVGSGGKGKDHWVRYHVIFWKGNKWLRQVWQIRPNIQNPSWNKVGEH